MEATSPRWQAITDSEFPWNQEALAFVRDRLPDHDPYRASANFEFIADDGSINEVDLLVKRERIALKVMLQILVDRRETLDLGEIVPVGDLFDAIAEGDEPFTESTRHHFEKPRKLYRRKLLPLARNAASR